MRTHLLFFDGSAVSASRGRDNDFSNVHKLNVAFEFKGVDGKPQFADYFGGVGTRGDRLAAATGRGFDQIVKEAYLNLSRTFVAETGTTPAKAIENLRLEAAKYLLEQSRIPVESIADKAWFGDRERMRRPFVRSYGKSPQAVGLEAGPRAAL